MIEGVLYIAEHDLKCEQQSASAVFPFFTPASQKDQDQQGNAEIIVIDIVPEEKGGKCRNTAVAAGQEQCLRKPAFQLPA